MKITKLSLIAVLAVSSLNAGNTTVSGKALTYYYTQNSGGTGSLFEAKSSKIASAVTLDVSHKIMNGMTANFSAITFKNWNDSIGEQQFEGMDEGAYFNVANITLKQNDTTVVLGRQLLDSPMFGGYDWFLAPGAFEAATVVNGSIQDLTLVGTYVTKARVNNAGNSFGKKLADNNFAVGGIYNNGIEASVWFYNIDIAKYTQVYADLGYNLGMAKVSGQVVTTSYDVKDGGEDSSLAFGAKVEGTIEGFTLTGAVTNVSTRAVAYVDKEALYTTSWNYFASNAGETGEDTLSFKVGASTSMQGMNAEASFALYGDEGSEFDIIVGYDISKSVNAGLVFSSTDYDVNNDFQKDADNALELFATYAF